MLVEKYSLLFYSFFFFIQLLVPFKMNYGELTERDNSQVVPGYTKYT